MLTHPNDQLEADEEGVMDRRRDERVSAVIARAEALSRDVTTTVAELVAILREYQSAYREEPHE